MPAIEVAAAVVFRDGKLLVTQRYPNAHLGGLWEFPGGKREAHETFQQCVVRELREELGIEVEVGHLLDSLTQEYPEKTVHLKFYHCRWRQNEPCALGCAAFQWITSPELQNYAFPAADSHLLEILRSLPALWQIE
jgi:mutator protein MutT